ncbi:MAG: GNAT family N-acetyltransferase [Archangium sp.]
MSLRIATPADQPLLEKWDQEPDVVFCTGEKPPPDEDDWDWGVELARNVSWREQLIIQEDARPIGVVQIIDPRVEETHYWGECEPDLRAIDIWLGEPGDRSRGLGRQAMELTIARCFAPKNVKAIIIDPLVANVRAIKFYERLGFKFIGERYFGNDHCHVMRLDR